MQSPPAPRSLFLRLVTTWLLTAVTDAIFSSVLVTVFYKSTFARLWQGVASVLLGPEAMNGGQRTVVIGLVMHFGVALAWSLVFLLLYESSHRIRELAHSRFGVIKVASVYGPFIWLVMSIIVIPLFAHRPPRFNFRWIVQLLGHIPFVAVPIVWGISRDGPPAVPHTPLA